MKEHPLTFWDAPFLPSGEPALGKPLREATNLPLSCRRQLASQLLAAVSFILQQGYFPGRALLRAARFTQKDGLAQLHLSRLPSRALDELLEARLARRGLGERLAWLVLRPFLTALLPEEAALWQRPPADPWAWPREALEHLLAKDRGRKALAHPAGFGRALWARQYVLPPAGVFYCQDPDVLSRLSSLPGVRVGAWSEESLGAVHGEVLARFQEEVVLSSVPLPGVPSLPLKGENPFWCFLPPQGESQAARSLAGVDAADAASLGVALAELVASAWGSRREQVPRLEGLLSYPARRLWQLLAGSGVGLRREEAARVVSSGQEALEELERFSLVVRRFGRYHAVEVGPPDLAACRELAAKLDGSPTGWVCQARVSSPPSALMAWAEERLQQEEAAALLALGPAAWQVGDLAPHLAEAALACGFLSMAKGLWKKAAGSHAALLHAWWAAEAGDGEALREALPCLPGEGRLPARLEGRKWLLLALWAERNGEEATARQWGARVLELSQRWPKLAVEAAFFLGREALQEFCSEGWSRPVRQRAWHLAGILAFRKACYPQAQADFAQALACASGENPLRLGELLADAGSAALLTDKALAAERLLSAAEFWLGLAGSHRAFSLVRFNRAVLANDRLQWQRAQELLQSLAATGQKNEDGFWLVEWVRSWLACGEVKRVSPWRARLRELAQSSAPESLRQGAAAVLAHHALLLSAWEEAKGWAAAAEPSEKKLLQAFLAAGGGVLPPQGLSQRWGLALAAELLALARERPAEVSTRAGQALASGELEAALGVARALLAGPGWGLEASSLLRPLMPQVKKRLHEAGMEGWLALLRRRLGLDAVEVVQAVAALLPAVPTAAVLPAWGQLASALGLTALRLCRGSKELVRVGDQAFTWRGELAGFAVDAAPEPSEEVRTILASVLRHLPLPEAQTPGAGDPLGLTGRSEPMASLRREILRFGPLPVTVLICGQPGTGKERVARALHRVSGRRGEFVAVNCAGMPEGLLEAELFGVVRGAFTGADRDRPGLVEQAEGGTLFLDEIGELPLSLQAKLLRLLQEKEVRRVGGTRTRRVDVRFVAATNRDVAQAVQAGTFRRDLYDRLATVTLYVPALDQRREDIPQLVEELVAGMREQLGLARVQVENEVLHVLSQRAWPGNVRQLESVLLQALVRCQPGGRLTLAHLPTEGPEPAPGVSPWEQAKQAYARQYFTKLLAACGGNRSRAAQLAGLSRQSLHYHLRQLGLERLSGA